MVGATTNMPSGVAFKPGDVVQAASGKYIEIINTDAEGRLVLADLLDYVRRYQPSAIVDAATLTGACVVALGHIATGVFGNDQALVAEVLAAGERAAERGWQMPVWDDYRDSIKSDVADIKNTGGRSAGAITGGEVPSGFRRHHAMGASGYRGNGVFRIGPRGDPQGAHWGTSRHVCGIRPRTGALTFAACPRRRPTRSWQKQVLRVGLGCLAGAVFYVAPRSLAAQGSAEDSAHVHSDSVAGTDTTRAHVSKADSTLLSYHPDTTKTRAPTTHAEQPRLLGIGPPTTGTGTSCWRVAPRP